MSDFWRILNYAWECTKIIIVLALIAVDITCIVYSLVK